MTTRDGTESPSVSPETGVPDGETPAATCPYCDRSFRQTRLRDLHVGGVHGARSDAERTAYRAAVAAEDEDLFRYHLKVAGGLGIVYAVLFILAIVGFSV